MVKSYRTITRSTEGYYKEKGSKFLAFAHPVADIESVKVIVADLRKKYYDARHHCYAYIIGVDRPLVRAYDDGEPNHSAGDPILGQIRSLGLTHVLVAVVRYFGGTKLGVSGLVQAYKTAAKEALDRVEIVEVMIKTSFKISFKYEQTSELMRILNELEVEIIDQKFEDSCELSGKVDPDRIENLRSKLTVLKINI